MIIIPKEEPVIAKLNTYYVDIERLIEHYQGELGSGAVHFNSVSIEGAVFFDKDQILNGAFKDKDGNVEREASIQRFIRAAAEHNFSIDVYRLDPEQVYFWASVSAGEEIYRDLSTEFTDLEGLIRKMCSEKLTGFISVTIGDGEEGGLLFFNSGEIIGGSYSWGGSEINGSKENKELLIKKTIERGGTFSVSKISLKQGEAASASEEIIHQGNLDVFSLLGEFLGIFERMIASNKKTKESFHTLLNKKLVEKADEYTFLDPFAGEFKYSGRQVSYSGSASEEELANGVIISVKELAGELDVLPQFREQMTPFSKKYAKEMKRLGIHL